MTFHMHRRETTRTVARNVALAQPVVSACRMLAALSALVLYTSTAGASCWDAAGARYGVHPWLLAAIAKVESGFNPSALNGMHAARTGSVDLGLMQINSSWLPVLARHGITREHLFDPCTSITVGAWILADLFARHGVSWEAVGAYNAACTRLEPVECAARRATYARKVEAALRQLVDPASLALLRGSAPRIVLVSVDERHATRETPVASPGGGGQ